jgi:5'-deoxynucleotidase YfbR-like HD superfamily hydrolase
MDMSTETEKAQLEELKQRTEAAAEAMRTGLDQMQAALDEAWEWYEAVQDETKSITEVGL